MNLREAYQAYGEGGQAGARARLVLYQQHWYGSIADFDPRTGEALPVGLDTLLRRLTGLGEITVLRDRLWRIVEHSRSSVERIMGSLAEDPRREQAILPIRDVKELNATSFIALSRRPGRNVREKLAGKPYMQAVRRFQSVDLPQNRLVKEYVTRLADLLECRSRCLGQEDALLGDIHRWLRSEEAQSIARWDNLPPNNTLLSHRDYRRVWDSWTWLQTLDEAIARDSNRIAERTDTCRTWTAYGKAYAEGKTLFGAMPVLFKYDSFSIEPWRDLVRRPTPSVSRSEVARPPVAEPVCIDLSYLRPRYARAGGGPAASLPEAYIWQRWSRAQESVDLELYNADMVLMDPDSTSVTCADLLFAKGGDAELLDRAAHAFSLQLGRTFANQELIWLVPDFLNDFQLQVARRNINARFSRAEPLPRSVAGVIEHVDYRAIKADGFRVVVVDSVGGTTYATKLVARHDQGLQGRVPATRGFYWERAPHVTIEHDGSAHQPLAEIPRMVSDGRWIDASTAPRRGRLDLQMLRRNPHIGAFDLCITIDESPVRGGIRLHELQQHAGDIPLWRDHIPELSIKILKEGLRKPFYLVSANTTIRPIRGSAVRIPVRETFELRGGQSRYEFPLFQGEAASRLGYEAILQSPSFPLPDKTDCALELTYTYGADDPYLLRFRPLDESFPPVVATWRPMSERPPIDLTTLPIPPFPDPATWEELQHWPRPEPHPKTGSTESDLLEWVTSALASLDPEAQRRIAEDQARKRGLRRLEAVLNERFQGSVKFGRLDRNGRYYCWVDIGRETIFCHESDFVEQVDEHTLSPGDSVFLSVDRRGDKPFGRYASYTDPNPPELGAKLLEGELWKAGLKFTNTLPVDYDRVRNRIFSARFPTYVVWRHGRSIKDPKCPRPFRDAVLAGIADSIRLLDQDTTPNDLKEELFFLLCRMHEDSPESVHRRLTQIVSQQTLSRNLQAAIAYSVGSCSQDWQQRILQRLVSSTHDTAIWTLSVVFWRSAEPISRLTDAQLNALLPFLNAHLEQQVAHVERGESTVKAATALELLLALLRTRQSEDSAIRALLSPDSEYGLLFAEQIDKITNAIVENSLKFRSRLDLKINKPIEFSNIPDLLYALRLYLTGDDGASAVRIAGVSDE